MKGNLQDTKTAPRCVVLIATPTAAVRSQWTLALKDMYTVLDVGERGSLDRSLADLKPDILLLDLALHRLGGLEGVQAIGAIEPRNQDRALREVPQCEGGDLLAEGRGLGILRKGDRTLTPQESRAHAPTRRGLGEAKLNPSPDRRTGQTHPASNERLCQPRDPTPGPDPPRTRGCLAHWRRRQQ